MWLSKEFTKIVEAYYFNTRIGSQMKFMMPGHADFIFKVIDM